MIKKNLPLLIITSIIILLPVCVGLILWNSLPEQIAIHWNVQGVADGFAGKATAVFALPCFLLVMHWICTLVTSADPKVKNVQGKPLTLVLWICPVISLVICSIVYAVAMGYNISIEIIMPIVMGVLFVLIGNYMPKCKQNHTIGIKLPWTLDDSENWNTQICRYRMGYRRSCHYCTFTSQVSCCILYPDCLNGSSACYLFLLHIQK